jgi:hypothetical protein
MVDMQSKQRFQRPTFEEALAAWQRLLGARGFSTDILWILDENLCFERDQSVPGGFKLGFQTQFTPHPPDAAKSTYHHFAEIDARMVFYRLGGSGNRSVCVHLCDPWFEPKTEAEGYIRRDDWLLSFYPGANDQLEEITEESRWKQRVVRGRPLSAVDFCMTLAALRELKAHGRVLSPDERFGLQILRSMHRVQS